MNAPARDPFGARFALPTPAGTVTIYRLDALAKKFSISLEKLPFSIRVLLEAALRTCDDYQVTQDDVGTPGAAGRRTPASRWSCRSSPRA